MLSLFGGKKREEQLANERAQFESEKEAWMANAKNALVLELQQERDAFERDKAEWEAATRASLVEQLKDERESHVARIQADCLHFEVAKSQWKEETLMSLRQQVEAEKEAFEAYCAATNGALERQRLEMHEQLSAEKVAIEHNRLALESLKAKLMAHSAIPEDETVTLNVGGCHFMCRTVLLTKIPDTFLSALISGGWKGANARDGTMFIDRDPEVFPIIMTFLRTFGTSFNWDAYRATWTAREALLVAIEAEFYLLKPFMLPPLDGRILNKEQWALIVEDKFVDRELLYDSNVHEFTREELQHRVHESHSNILLVARLSNGDTLGWFTPFLSFKLGAKYSHATGVYVFRTDNASKGDPKTYVSKINIPNAPQWFQWEEAPRASSSVFVGKNIAYGESSTQPGITIVLGGAHKRHVRWFIDNRPSSFPFTSLEIWRLITPQ